MPIEGGGAEASLERVPGNNLREQIKNLNADLTVANSRNTVPKLLESKAGVLVEESVKIDYTPIGKHMNGRGPTVLESGSAYSGNEELIYKWLYEDLKQHPPEIQKLLSLILTEAKALRKMFPDKSLLSVKIRCWEGAKDGTQPEPLHQDGDPGIVRIIKIYQGPSTEFSNRDKTKIVSPPSGTLAVFKTGPKGPMHRRPGVSAGTYRVQLQLELAE